MKFILKLLIERDFAKFERLNLAERKQVGYVFCDTLREIELEKTLAGVKHLVFPIFTQDLTFKQLLTIRKKLKNELVLAEECLKQIVGR